jgi:hypothetical protein
VTGRPKYPRGPLPFNITVTGPRPEVHLTTLPAVSELKEGEMLSLDPCDDPNCTRPNDGAVRHTHHVNVVPYPRSHR